jgi:hypothetical protein
MLNVLARTSVLVAVLVSLLLTQPQVRADDKPSEKLTLKSNYSGKVLLHGARRVNLSLTLDKMGGGSGMLTLDPNISDGMISTTIAIRTIPIQLQVVHDDEQAAKGRRLYELKAMGHEGKAEQKENRWFLVKPLKKGMPCWLVFANKDGKFQDVLILQ